MPITCDVGTPLNSTVRLTGPYGTITAPAGDTLWDLVGPSSFSRSFAVQTTTVPNPDGPGTIQRVTSGHWQPLVVRGVNPIQAVPRVKGGNTLHGYFLYRAFNSLRREVADTVQVLGPEADPNPAVTLGTVSVVDTVVREQPVRLLQSGERQHVPGDLRVGIRIDFGATSNDGCSGELGVISLIASSRLAHKADGRVMHSTTRGRYVLDNARSSQTTYLYQGNVVVLHAGARARYTFHDTPAMGLLNDDRHVSVEDSFLTMLVFQSDKDPQACWVPVQTILWGWTAYARWDATANEWAVDRDRSRVWCRAPLGGDSDLLSWDNNIHAFEYHDFG